MTEVLGKVEFWHWWVLAALLMTIEVFAPTTVFLWMGISAVVVGLVVLIAPDIAIEPLILIFAVLSVVSAFAWRHYARLHPAPSQNPSLNRRAEQYIGRQFTLEEPIIDRRGMIRVDDATWRIEGEDAEAGARVKVVGANGAILTVERA